MLLICSMCPFFKGHKTSCNVNLRYKDVSQVTIKKKKKTATNLNDLGPRMRWLVYASVSPTIVWENVLPHMAVVGTKYNMVPAYLLGKA